MTVKRAHCEAEMGICASKSPQAAHAVIGKSPAAEKFAYHGADARGPAAPQPRRAAECSARASRPAVPLN